MPPGNVRTKPTNKVIERATAGACLAIAQRVEDTRRLAGDSTGAEAAREVAAFIREELLKGSPSRV